MQTSVNFFEPLNDSAFVESQAATRYLKNAQKTENSETDDDFLGTLREVTAEKNETEAETGRAQPDGQPEADEKNAHGAAVADGENGPHVQCTAADCERVTVDEQGPVGDGQDGTSDTSEPTAALADPWPEESAVQSTGEISADSGDGKIRSFNGSELSTEMSAGKQDVSWSKDGVHPAASAKNTDRVDTPSGFSGDRVPDGASEEKNAPLLAGRQRQETGTETSIKPAVSDTARVGEEQREAGWNGEPIRETSGRSTIVAPDGNPQNGSGVDALDKVSADTGNGDRHSNDGSGLFNANTGQYRGGEATAGDSRHPFVLNTGDGSTEGAGIRDAVVPETVKTDATPMPEDGAGTGKNTAFLSETGESRWQARVEQQEVMSQIMDRAAVTLRKGHSEMRVVLKPESLGQVRMQVSMADHRVTVHIVAENQGVKEAIESNLGQLKADLASQGLEVDAFDVRTSTDSQNQEAFSRQLNQRRSISNDPSGVTEETSEQQTADRMEIDRHDRHPGAVDFFA